MVLTKASILTKIFLVLCCQLDESNKKSYDKPQRIWDIYSPTEVIHIFFFLFFWQSCSLHLKKKFMKLNASVESPHLGHSLKAVFFCAVKMIPCQPHE